MGAPHPRGSTERIAVSDVPEPICDSHAHLNFPEFEGRLLDVLRRAAEAQVQTIINIGTHPETNPVTVEQTLALPAQFEQAFGGDGSHDAAAPAELECPRLYASLGFHPHEAQHIRPEHWGVIEGQAAEPQVIALGEFGLDYHYEHSPRDAQKRVLRRGIELALKVGLPMVIHSREARLEVVEALDEVAGGAGAAMPRGVFHCFTDPWPVAEAALERGFYVGFTGIATYPNAADVREVARRVPLERIVVETDAPFCTPEPVRSERRKRRRKGKDEPNEPALVGLVCDLLARLHGVEVSEVRRRTLANTRDLFDL